MGPDDDDVGPDDDDVGPDDDDIAPDDDDVTPVCDDDSFEANDQQGAAATLNHGEHGGLRLCMGSDDWYEVWFNEGDEVELEAWFAHADGDLDMSLHTPDGSTIFVAESADDDEELEFVVPFDGFRYLRVYLYDDFGPDDGVDYTLSVGVE